MITDGRTVLIVEDEIIVAFALEDMLLDMGLTVTLASTVEQAMAELDSAMPSFAVLDVNVHGLKSYPIAQRLHRSAVPVIFATGYGDAEHPPEFVDTPTLTKPYTREHLAEAIARLE